MSFFSKTKNVSGWMSVNLCSDGIYACHVKRSPQGLYAMEWIACYPGQASSFAVLLEKVAKELHAERYQCTSLLAAGEYHLLTVEAPTVPPDELKTAIRWRLKDMLDYHIDDAAIDVIDIPIDKNAAVRNHSMYAVAARNQLIEGRQALFANAKIPLSVIDIPEMAQRNISALVEIEGRGLAMLSFDTDGGLLTVNFSGELYLSRRIDVTLAQISQADNEQKNACYERITLELQRSLDHFDRQYHFISISKLMLGPLDEATEGLKGYLSQNLYIPVDTLNLRELLDISKTPELKSLEMQRRYFMAIGAAMRHEERAL